MRPVSVHWRELLFTLWVECAFRGAVVGLFMDVLSFNCPTRKRIRDHAFVFFRDRAVPDPLSDSSDRRLCTFMPAPACRKDGYGHRFDIFTLQK